TTDGSGQVITTLSANTTAGSYTISAAAAGVGTPASFGLTNTPDAAYSITSTSGGGQSATVHTGFAGSLVATVTDQYGNVVTGVSAPSSPPAPGAGPALAPTPPTTAAKAQVSTPFTATPLAGNYSVTASTIGVTPAASYTLTNTPDAPATISATSGGGQSATV